MENIRKRSVFCESNDRWRVNKKIIMISISVIEWDNQGINN